MSSNSNKFIDETLMYIRVKVHRSVKRSNHYFFEEQEISNECSISIDEFAIQQSLTCPLSTRRYYAEASGKRTSESKSLLMNKFHNLDNDEALSIIEQQLLTTLYSCQLLC